MAPTGPIDPMLRTIAFLDSNDVPIVAMHYYASHPMAAYPRNMVGADVPGVALAYAAEHGYKDTYNIYFTGCAGDVAFGKYTDLNFDNNLQKLGNRLGQGMVQNLKHLEKKPIGELVVAHENFEFPLHSKLDKRKLTAELKSISSYKQYEQRKIKNYCSVLNDWDRFRLDNAQISRLSIGRHIHILSLLSETCVEYQIFAQSLVPEEFLACVAYSNDGYSYIPTAEMMKQGGYEGDFANIGAPSVEVNYKTAIQQLLAPVQ
jgi:hypothetical protein